MARAPVVVRVLLARRAAGAALELDQVEPTGALCKRFVASAMSLGSLSPEAHQCITIAMNTLGARSNTGEGGEDPEVYRIHAATVVSASGHEAATAQTWGGTAVAGSA